MKEVTIYTDGSARSNPDGPGGYGSVLLYVDKSGQVHTRELSQGYERTTNNRMEMMAVIAGLELLKEPCNVTIYSDSQYVVKAFMEGWIVNWQKKNWMRGKDPVKNVDLWKRMLRAMEGHDAKFVWVKGHAGNKYNEICDSLATSAADNGPWLIDEEYVKNDT